MKTLRNAVVCCLISIFAAFPLNAVGIANTARCAVPGVEQALKDSKAVFVGKVTGVVKEGDIKTFTFEVEKLWKGAANEEIEVSVHETMRYQAWFEVGEKYLVYARGADDDKLREVRCSRSKSLADASEDISALGRSK